jgi:glucose-6-phosphate isomerase
VLQGENFRGPFGLAPGAFASEADSLVPHDTAVTVSDLRGVFADEAARAGLPGHTCVYTTRTLRPVPEGTVGGLFCGETRILPGRIGTEYFMTRGHFHANRDRAEYYWCTGGEGILLLMDEERRCRAECMRPGSVHYVPGRTAHRTVNTGREVLCVSACWPSDAGHDYASIAREGFPLRIICVDDAPAIVEASG